MLGNEHRLRRQRPTVRTDGHIVVPSMDPVADLSERVDTDAEMLDVEAEIGEGEGGAYPYDAENENPPTGLVSRGPGFGRPLPGNSSGERDDGSECDGSQSGSAEGGIAGLDDTSPETETVISGKRKR